MSKDNKIFIEKLLSGNNPVSYLARVALCSVSPLTTGLSWPWLPGVQDHLSRRGPCPMLRNQARSALPSGHTLSRSGVTDVFIITSRCDSVMSGQEVNVNYSKLTWHWQILLESLTWGCGVQYHYIHIYTRIRYSFLDPFLKHNYNFVLSGRIS